MPAISSEKKVLLVVRYPVGGIRTYLKYVYKKEFFGGYRFTIVLPNHHSSNMFLHSGTGMEVEHVVCNANTFSIIRTVFTHLKSGKYSLVHSHGFTSGICSVLSARFFGIPHIMTAHDVLLDKQFTGIIGALKRMILPYFFNLIDVIHTVSHDVNVNINKMLPSVNHEQLKTIQNGIDVNQYIHSNKRDFRTELGLDENIYLILFLGRFMSQKGFKYLIEAIDLVVKSRELTRDLRVLAIGSDGFIREDKEIIRNKELDRYFIFLPPVDNAAPSIKGVDVVTMPSLWEASGLIAMETLISGIPLIASECIGLREVINNTPTFVIKPANSKSLATAIMNCISDSKIIEFRNYVSTAIVRFDARRTSNELYELYNSVC